MTDSLEGDGLDRVAWIYEISRFWSREQTEECPMPDYLNGGFCESDAQLRARIKRELSKPGNG
jgi:hypothetical protein